MERNADKRKRRTSKESSRRVQRLGSTSLVVTLPKLWTLRFNVKPGDKLLIIDEGYQLRILPPKEPDKKLLHAKIRLRQNIEPRLFSAVLHCLYMKGFDDVILTTQRDNEDSIEDSIISLSTHHEKKQIETVQQDVSLFIEKVVRDGDGYKLKFRQEDEDEDVLSLAKKYMSDLYLIFEKIGTMGKRPNDKLLREVIQGLELLRLKALKLSRVRLYSASSSGLCEHFPFILGQLSLSTKRIVMEASQDEKSWKVLSSNAGKLKSIVVETLSGLLYPSWKRLDIGLKLIQEIKKDLRYTNFSSHSEERIAGKVEFLLDLLETLVEVCACSVVVSDLIKEQVKERHIASY
ncbi:MAG: AbrB/MazE/SpoVT family DNA-binding domain-containing protein [Acidilobaceae archaeon]